MPDIGSLFSFIGGGVIPVLLVVVILVLVVAYLGSRYKVAGANEALIISGRRERGPEAGLKVVRGQGVIVLPLVNKVGRLHLSARQINVQLSDAVTKQGIKCAVQGVATVKIGSDEESIRAAAERFLEREDQIDSIVKNVLEGSL
ncbi:MAG: flotillin family protein, partial [Chloroflexi bacterium]|nr:flotillin family protein [Chloroflexota bacterium]